jgi:hypothetical protein
MKRTFKTKIFNNNLNSQPKVVNLNTRLGAVGNNKYLPSFSKEWKNIIYSFNKNNMKNIPVNDRNINKIIKSYFNLFFKDHKYVGNSKFILLKRRRRLLKRIFVSNAEIKHTNNKAKITLFTVNREKRVLKEKFLKLSKKIFMQLYKRYGYVNKNYINFLYKFVNALYKNKNEYFFANNSIKKINYLNHKLNYLQVFTKLHNLLLKKVWTVMIRKQSRKYIRFLRKYNLLYSLNQFKFNKLILLPKLSGILHNILGKKLEYNIINMKSISYNTDIFTDVLALKIKKIKSGHIHRMFSVLNRAYLPKVNTIQERTRIQSQDNFDLFVNKYKDLKVLSNINNKHSLSSLLNEELVIDTSTTNIQSKNKDENKINYFTQPKKVHNVIYNSIKYKNMSGIRLEVKGRLTKRYRADRSVYSLKWKGGLKNIDSSFKGLSSVLFRGNTNSNTSYSIAKSKRRVGAFAVKGWIGGK